MKSFFRKLVGREVPFSALPIRVKLVLIILSVCGCALLLSTLLETAFNWAIARRELMKQLSVTADIISLQSRAALEFVDPVAARENLASLRPDPNILQACLYNEQSQLFAAYRFEGAANKAKAPTCPARQTRRDLYHWRTLEIHRDIIFNQRTIGGVYLEYDLSLMYGRFGEEALYKLAIVVCVLLVIWRLSFYFQRMISQPIVQLADISRRFSADRSQPIQAAKTGDDEIGELVDAYNAMMAEIRRNEKRLGEAVTELKRSNTELERFAYICSHDLQEPLRMVSSYAGLLERKIQGQLDEDTRQYLFYITDGASRMRELINDILAYSRIGNQSEPMQPVDLEAVLNYVLQNLSASIREADAVITRSDMPVITGNKTLITQVFQNLISNALKFCQIEPKIDIMAERIPRAWQFVIRDNGIGIDPKYHEKIFEIFRRLNRREEYRGTGIGLAICKKAVETHGGTIWLASETGKGTSFFFTIPDSPDTKDA